MKIPSLFAALFVSITSVAHSVTIVQGGADNYIAFEAESGLIANTAAPDNIWSLVSDGTASGGTALLTVNSDPLKSSGSTPTSFVTYTMDFVNPGNYTVFYIWRTDAATLSLNVTNGNSFRISSAFNSAPNANSSSNGFGSATNIDFKHTSEAVGQFVVTTSGLQTFQIGDREAGMILDRFIFSTVAPGSMTLANLQALPNSSVIPEPSTWAMLAGVIAGLAVLGKRWRRK